MTCVIFYYLCTYFQSSNVDCAQYAFRKPTKDSQWHWTTLQRSTVICPPCSLVVWPISQDAWAGARTLYFCQSASGSVTDCTYRSYKRDTNHLMNVSSTRVSIPSRIPDSYLLVEPLHQHPQKHPHPHQQLSTAPYCIKAHWPWLSWRPKQT